MVYIMVYYLFAPFSECLSKCHVLYIIPLFCQGAFTRCPVTLDYSYLEYNLSA